MSDVNDDAPRPKPEPHISLSMCIDGASFSAQGPRDEVLRLYDEWKDLSGLNLPMKAATFNPPRIQFDRRP